MAFPSLPQRPPRVPFEAGLGGRGMDSSLRSVGEDEVSSGDEGNRSYSREDTERKIAKGKDTVRPRAARAGAP